MAPETTDPLTRIHERLDDLFATSASIQTAVKAIEERCIPCRKLVDSHESILHGNGKDGLVTRMATAETGRTDTLTVKAVISLIAAVGTLAATIGGAMAALISRS